MIAILLKKLATSYGSLLLITSIFISVWCPPETSVVFCMTCIISVFACFFSIYRAQGYNVQFRSALERRLFNFMVILGVVVFGAVEVFCFMLLQVVFLIFNLPSLI